jgi:hypothetical protein
LPCQSVFKHLRLWVFTSHSTADLK